MAANQTGEGDVLLQIEDDERKKIKQTRRKELQAEIKNELKNILNERDFEIGLSKLTGLLEGRGHDKRIKELEDIMKKMDTWDKSQVQPKSEPFLIRARCKWYLERMLERNRTYQPYLEKILEKFEMENEMIELDPRNDVSIPDWINADQSRKKTTDQNKPYAPIHFAVRSLNIDFVKWLLGRPNIEVNIRDRSGKTALFMLCEQYESCTESGELKDIQRCITLLLEHGADFNICSKEPKLPFGLLLRDTSKENETFVDDCMKKFSRAVLFNTESSVGFYKHERNVIVTVELLEIYMRFKEDTQFARYFEKFTIDQSNIRKVIKLLFPAAAEMNLEKYAKMIIERSGPNILLLDEAKGLLRNACENGSVDMLKLLLENINDQERLNGDPVLNLTLYKAGNTKNEIKQGNILQCAELLAKDTRIRLVATDSKGRHAVHVAFKYGFTDVARSLLQHRNIFLGTVNSKSLLELAKYDFWKLYFDRCLAVDGDPKDVKLKDIQLKLNGLSPFAFRSDATEEGGKNQYKCCLKASLFSTTNTLKVTDMDVVKEMAESKYLEPLLVHPAVYTYVLVKWFRVSHYCFLNFICTLAAAICFGFYTFDQCNNGDPSSLLSMATWTLAACLSIRKIIQFLFNPLHYLLSSQNILDIVAIGLIIRVLITSCNSILSLIVMLALALRLTNLIGLMLGNMININLVILLKCLVPCYSLLKNSSALSYFKSSPKNASVDNVNSVLNNSTNYYAWLVDTNDEFGVIHVLVVLVIFVLCFVLQSIQSSEQSSIKDKAIVLQRYARGLHNPPAKLLLRTFPCLERQFTFFETHSCDILVKQTEFNKVLVQRWVGSGKKAKKNAKTKFFQNCVVSTLPGGLCGDTADGVECLGLRFYLTLSGPALEEAQRIVDDAAKKNEANVRLKVD